MNLLVLNLLLSFGWAAVTANFTLGGLLMGYLIGFGCLWVVRPLFGTPTYFDRTGKVVFLFVYFLYELIVSTLRVVWDVITPKIQARPGVVAVPLDAETDLEIMLLANMISLTPGTLSLDVSADRKTLFVHAMFIDDINQVRTDIKTGMERRLLEAMR